MYYAIGSNKSRKSSFIRFSFEQLDRICLLLLIVSLLVCFIHAVVLLYLFYFNVFMFNSIAPRSPTWPKLETQWKRVEMKS